LRSRYEMRLICGGGNACGLTSRSRLCSSGGELAAIVLFDKAAPRFRPLFGSGDIRVNESVPRRLPDYPHYTRPTEFRGCGCRTCFAMAPSRDRSLAARGSSKQSVTTWNLSFHDSLNLPSYPKISRNFEVLRSAGEAAQSSEQSSVRI